MSKLYKALRCTHMDDWPCWEAASFLEDAIADGSVWHEEVWLSKMAASLIGAGWAEYRRDI